MRRAFLYIFRAIVGRSSVATHRDLHQALETGKFRKDLYYRLCSDIITTPSLNQQIRESPEVLWDLVGYISKRIAGSESERLAEEVKSWIRDRLGLEYTWPGNIRELEQCVRNIVIRREYHPAMDKPQEQDEGFIASMREGTLSLEAMCRLYCTQIYNQAGFYAETARRLKIDQRTVKKDVAGSKPH